MSNVIQLPRVSPNFVAEAIALLQYEDETRYALKIMTALADTPGLPVERALQVECIRLLLNTPFHRPLGDPEADAELHARDLKIATTVIDTLLRIIERGTRT